MQERGTKELAPLLYPFLDVACPVYLFMPYATV